MDDAALVAAVAAQYLRLMEPDAIRFLREMQHLATGLPDVASAEAWRDIGDAVHALAPVPI